MTRYFAKSPSIVRIKFFVAELRNFGITFLAWAPLYWKTPPHKSILILPEEPFESLKPDAV